MSHNLCILCRGAKYLCGRAYCPVFTKLRVTQKVFNASTQLFGSSPPAVFVGRIGYPQVFAGPLAPNDVGNTEAYDFPELWSSRSLDEVLDMRLSLFLGRRVVDVRSVEDRYVQELQLLVLPLKSVDVEVRFAKRPIGFSFSEYEPPMGPRAPIESFRVVSTSSPARAVEKLYSDVDAKAGVAVIELYSSGVPVSHIQKLLSVGALGRKRSRRLVPTRWAITAVDDTISRHLIEEKVKWFNSISEVQVFVRQIHKNLFISILVPGEWGFEWMEAWFPRSTWNPFGESVAIEGDHELFRPRDEYASIGGCYYAARLATVEYLVRVSRKATAIVLREIYPGFDIPIGVWFVREQLRALYSQQPYKVSSIEEALKIVDKFSALGSRIWAEKSKVLKLLKRVKKIDEFLKRD
jgi:Uncharacterized conserved protein|uniref:DNA repair protein n=1 Tax=Ignisphaera aggregans TaxID=334771 RepID=A0A7J3ZAA1_9CREN